MFLYFLLGIALLAGLLLFGRWFGQADPKSLFKVLKWVLVTVIVAVALFFVMTGRAVFALAAIPALIPWILRIRSVARAAKAFHRMAQSRAGNDGTQSSEIQTRFLKMALSHESGAMWGEVIDGPFAGRPLADLSVAQLCELLTTYQNEDSQSAQILISYLDREHPEWRSSAQDQGHDGYENSSPEGMTRHEALKILGLEEGVDEASIRAAHHRLIAIVHPDKGGSTYLAARINQAKDVLLGS